MTAPAMPFAGCVVKTSFVAAPAYIVNELLVADVSPVPDATSDLVPAVSKLRFVNVANPVTSVTR